MEQEINQETKQWKYDAFISYRHLEPDAYVAGTIHKLLESYQLPGKLVKSNGEKLKRRKINKVFRDAEELPLTNNLSDTIMEALKDSEYLIVICSPKLSESLWCKKEIDTFLALRGPEYVLTVLADGEPAESFPEALLYKNVQVKLADGTMQEVREPVEPLAADARGETNKERSRKLKTEVLRLMAPMFGCSFDDLRQRQRERQVKRAIRIAAMITATSLAFGVVSTGLSLTIQKQNEKITSQNDWIREQNDQILTQYNQINGQNEQIREQNDQIREQNDQIRAQAQELEEQYKKLLISNGNITAEYARKLYEEGDRINAVKKAYEAYPHEGVEVPLLDQVELVLSDALHWYQNGRMMLPDRKLQITSGFDEAALNQTGTRLGAWSDDGVFRVWDMKNGSVLFEYRRQEANAAENRVLFQDEDHFWLISDNVLSYCSVSDGTMDKVKDVTYNTEISYDRARNRLLVGEYGGFTLYDTETNELVARRSYRTVLDMAEDDGSASAFGYSKLKETYGRYFASVVEKSRDRGSFVLVFDSEDGSMVGQYEIQNGTLGTLSVLNNRLYLAINYQEKQNGYLFKDGMHSQLYSFEITEEGLKLCWDTTTDGGFVYGMIPSNSGEGNVLLCHCRDSLFFIEKATGKRLKEYTLSSKIIQVFGYVQSDLFSVVTQKGEWLIVQEDEEEPVDIGFFEKTTEDISHFYLAGGTAVCVPNQKSELMIYKYALSPAAEAVEPVVLTPKTYPYSEEELKKKMMDLGVSRSFLQNVFCSEDGRYLGACYLDASVELYRLDEEGTILTESVRRIENLPTRVNAMDYRPDETMLVLYSPTEGYLFRLTKPLSEEFPTEEQRIGNVAGFYAIDFEKDCLYVKSNKEYYRIPLATEKLLSEAAEKELEKGR